MNKSRTSSPEEVAWQGWVEGDNNMAEKERSLLAKDRRNSPRFKIIVGLGVYSVGSGAIENALTSWVKERDREQSLYVVDQIITFGKRLRLHRDSTEVLQAEFETVAIVSGDLGKLYNEPRPDEDVDLEEEIMNMLKSLTRRLAKDLGRTDAELSYGNLKCSLE